MRSESNIGRYTSKTQTFIQNYDYIPKPRYQSKHAPSLRGYELNMKHIEGNRNYQMNVIQNKRNYIDEIKREENRSFQNNNMSSLLSGLKSELGQITMYINDTNNKVDNHLQNTSTTNDYITKQIRNNKKFNYDYSHELQLQSPNQKPNTYSTSLTKCPIRPDSAMNQYLKETKAKDYNIPLTSTNTNTHSYMNNILKKYPSYSYLKHDQDNNLTDKSFTYQYEVKQNDYPYNKTELKAKSNPTNAYQDKINLLESKLESSNKLIPELVAKVNYLQHSYDSMKNDKEKAETRCTLLENEYLEAKINLLNEIEMKKNYLSMHNKSSQAIEKNEQRLNDYEKIVKELQKVIKEKNEEISNSKRIINNKDPMKDMMIQLDTKKEVSPNVREMDEKITKKEAELVEMRLLNEDLKKKIHAITEKNTKEKNELIDKMSKMNERDNDNNNDDNETALRLLEENDKLKREIEHLKEEIENYIKSNNTKRKENEETKEEYSTLRTDYNRYQTETNNQFDNYKTQIANLIETNNQFKSDSDRKNTQINLLSTELSNKKGELGQLTKENNSLKEINEQLSIKVNDNQRTINELIEANNQLKAQVNVYKNERLNVNSDDKSIELLILKQELSKLNEENIDLKNTIDKLTGNIEVYQSEYKKAQERNESDSHQMQIGFDQKLKEAKEANDSMINKLSIQLENEQALTRKYKNDIDQLNTKKESKTEYESQCVILQNKIQLIAKENKDREEALINEMNSIKDKYNQTSNELSNSLLNNNQLNQRMDQMSKDTNADKETILNLQLEISQLKKESNEQIMKNTQLVDEYNTKTTSIESDLIKEKESLLKQVSVLTEEISRLKQENNLQFKTINLLQDKDKDTIQSSNDQLTSKELTITQLTNELRLLTGLKQQSDNENSQLKSQLEDTNKKLDSLIEENNQMAIQVTKVNSLESQNQKLKSENESTFNQLKAQIDNNKDLLSQLENQKEAIDQFIAQEEKKSETFADELLQCNSIENQQEEVNDLYNTVNQCKETILSLQSLIEQRTQEKNQLDNELNEANKEIEDYKKINDKLIQTNSELKSNRENTFDKGNALYRQSLTKAEDINEEDIQNLHMTIECLRELINQKDQEIIALKQKHIEIEAEDAIKQSEPSLSGSMLTDAEKYAKSKERIESLKVQQQSDLNQIALLKAEIKELNIQIDKLKSFEGRITSYEEFIRLYQIAFENYQPKKKEQEEALRKLDEHLSIHETEESSSTKKQKKGIFDKLFKR